MNNVALMDVTYDKILGLARSLADDGHAEVATYFEKRVTELYDRFLQCSASNQPNGPMTVEVVDQLTELVDQLEKVINLNLMYLQIKGKNFD